MRETLFFLLLGHVQSISKKPNVIVILADDLGHGDMPWNNGEIIAPNLLRLAKSGTIITDMYVQPVCTPSRQGSARNYFFYYIDEVKATIFSFLFFSKKEGLKEFS